MNDVERSAIQARRWRAPARPQRAPAHDARPRRRLLVGISPGRASPCGLPRRASGQPATARERRHHGRVPFAQQLLFRAHERMPAAVARTRDLGGGGLFIESDRPLRTGEIIVGTFRVDPAAAQRPIAFVAEVLRRTHTRRAREGFAVRFLFVSDEDRQRIADLVALHARAA